MDCGNPRVVEEVTRMQREGRIQKLDSIYITHYHDDHTNMAQAMADEFHCPVYFCREMRDILEHPEAVGAAGGRIPLAVILRNHSAAEREFRVTPRVPAGWRAPAGPLRVLVPAHGERTVRFGVTAGAAGLGIVTADVAFGAWDLREWIEAMVTVK